MREYRVGYARRVARPNDGDDADAMEAEDDAVPCHDDDDDEDVQRALQLIAAQEARERELGLLRAPSRPPDRAAIDADDDVDAAMEDVAADLDDPDLRRALATSRREHEDTLLAQMIQAHELAVADQELARALEASSREADRRHQEAALHRALEEQRQTLGRERHEGSWDCVACTLRNDPYQRACHACGTAAPPHVLVFEDVPPDLGFGVELEMIVENGRRDGLKLDSIARDLTRFGPDTVCFMGYSHETMSDWKIVTDSSLAELHEGHDLCMELVSPVLRGEAGLAALRRVLENVRRLGVATNGSCGFHVHVDATPQASPALGSLAALKRLANCFVALENAFDLLVALAWDDGAAVHLDRRGNQNRYCRSNRLAFGEQSNQQRWHRIAACQSRQALVDLVNPQQDRYRKLNLTNLVQRNRPSTCEFRHHGGVVSIPEAEAWVRLVLRFCQHAGRGGAGADACLLPEGSSPREELRALFDLVRCPGVEQFFAVERRLFAADRVAATAASAWDCRVCRRRFATSRSLAQHAAACRHY